MIKRIKIGYNPFFHPKKATFNINIESFTVIAFYYCIVKSKIHFK